MNNGMSILGIGIDWQMAIKGTVLALAVWFDVWNRDKMFGTEINRKKFFNPHFSPPLNGKG